MSFLNSVLSSIGGESASPSTPRPQQPLRDAPRPASQTTAITAKTSVNTNATQANANTPSLKRKADEISSSKPSARPDSTAQPKQDRAIIRKTAPSQAVASSTSSLSAAAKPVSRPNGNSTNTRPSANPAVAAALTAPKPPPAKGSYREIMERAKAAKATQGAVGAIKHKPTIRMTKRERRLARQAEEAAKQKSGGNKQAKTSSGISSKTSSGNAREPFKEKKKPVEFAYKGTMRPTGATTVVQRGPRKDIDHGKPPQRDWRYNSEGYSDEDEDEYGSDESDMEAAGFDALEEEEQMSLRVAQKEDQEALRQESEHRRLKMEKKRKLEELVAARKKRAG